MNKTYHDDDLKALFQRHKQEITDDGFSKKVNELLPAERQPLWHIAVLFFFVSAAFIVLFALQLLPSLNMITENLQQGIETFTQILLQILTDKYFYIIALLFLVSFAGYKVYKLVY